jgi:hypothetical protein
LFTTSATAAPDSSAAAIASATATTCARKLTCTVDAIAVICCSTSAPVWPLATAASSILLTVSSTAATISSSVSKSSSSSASRRRPLTGAGSGDAAVRWVRAALRMVPSPVDRTVWVPSRTASYTARLSAREICSGVPYFFSAVAPTPITLATRALSANSLVASEVPAASAVPV